MIHAVIRKITLLAAICAVAAALSPAQQKTADLDIAKCWEYKIAGGSTLAADDGGIYIGTAGAGITALSHDGKKLWAAELGGDITSNILAVSSGLFVVTSQEANGAVSPASSVLRGLSKETGITRWAVPLKNAERHFIGEFNGALIVVAASGSVMSINARNGSINWTRDIAGGFVAEPVYVGGKVVVATTARQIFMLASATGEIEALRKVQFDVTAVAVGLNGDLMAGDARGRVYSLGTAEKPVWRFKTGGQVSRIVADREHAIVTSYDNFVYYLISRNGAVAWKKRLAGRVGQIGNVGDKYVLVSGFEQHGAILVEIEKGRVAGQLAFGDDETMAAPVEFGGRIFALTNYAAYSYSLTGCIKK